MCLETPCMWHLSESTFYADSVHNLWIAYFRLVYKGARFAGWSGATARIQL